MTFLPWWAASLLIGVTHGHLRLNSIDAENSTMSRENTSATLTSPSKDKEKGFVTYGSIHLDHHVTPVSIQIRNAFGGMTLSENVTERESEMSHFARPQKSRRVQKRHAWADHLASPHGRTKKMEIEKSEEKVE